MHRRPSTGNVVLSAEARRILDEPLPAGAQSFTPRMLADNANLPGGVCVEYESVAGVGGDNTETYEMCKQNVLPGLRRWLTAKGLSSAQIKVEKREALQLMCGGK